MTTIFYSLSPVSSGKVKLANGSYIDIVGERIVLVTPILDLPSILHAPNLSRNLLLSVP